MSKPQRIVCFDLGGVVVRICRTWEQGCAAAGIEVRDTAAFATLDPWKTRQAVYDDYQSGRTDCAAFCASIAAATGHRYTPAEIERIHRAWVIEEYPGMGAIIDALNAIPGVVTACLSNTNRMHWDVEAEAGLWRSGAVARIQRHFVSHHMGAVKPDEAIYRMFELGIGAPADRITFFDDLPPNIEAARACGWDAVLIDHEGDTAAQVRGHLRDRGIVV